MPIPNIPIPITNFKIVKKIKNKPFAIYIDIFWLDG